VARALLDYVIYILLTSTVYSVVFAPGELATCIALALYLSRRQGLAEATSPADLQLEEAPHSQAAHE
jgi:hypothetical protein